MSPSSLTIYRMRFIGCVVKVKELLRLDTKTTMNYPACPYMYRKEKSQTIDERVVCLFVCVFSPWVMIVNGAYH